MKFWGEHAAKLALALLIVSSVWGQNALAQEGRNIDKYNLIEGNLGLKGYDPVAVFPEGGGEPLEGSPEIATEYEGVVYYFSSIETQALFEEAPEKYEPTYGGWCAYAMAFDSRVDIEPLLFTLNGNRAHYFVSRRAKRNFDRDVLGHEERADENWLNFSGESPRL